MKFRAAVALVVVVVWASFAAAQTLEGTVTNGTTGKPAAGAEVTLLSLSNGMSEAGHATTNAAGKFTLPLPSDSGMPHLVRVSHQNVNYFTMAPPGTTRVEVAIYDAAAKLDAVTATVQMMRLQSDGATLQMAELYAVRNASQPPRSLMNNRTFDFALPAGAEFDEAAATPPNGQPITTMPSPVAGKAGEYSFDFPLRPGETQFQIAYHLPYNGQATIKPILLHDVQHFVAFLPTTMQFQAVGSAPFVPMPGKAAAPFKWSPMQRPGRTWPSRFPARALSPILTTRPAIRSRRRAALKPAQLPPATAWAAVPAVAWVSPSTRPIRSRAIAGRCSAFLP